MSFETFRILFLRPAGYSSTDDILTIIPNQESERTFIVTYTDHYNHTSNQFEATEREILDYMENMIALLHIDDDPFDKIQIQCPTFPTVLIRVCDLHKDDIKLSVMDVVKSTLRCYPTKLRYRSLASAGFP